MDDRNATQSILRISYRLSRFTFLIIFLETQNKSPPRANDSCVMGTYESTAKLEEMFNIISNDVWITPSFTIKQNYHFFDCSNCQLCVRVEILFPRIEKLNPSIWISIFLLNFTLIKQEQYKNTNEIKKKVISVKHFVERTSSE